MIFPCNTGCIPDYFPVLDVSYPIDSRLSLLSYQSSFVFNKLVTIALYNHLLTINYQILNHHHYQPLVVFYNVTIINLY